MKSVLYKKTKKDFKILPNLEEYERQKERVFQEKKAKLAATERSKREEAQEHNKKIRIEAAKKETRRIDDV